MAQNFESESLQKREFPWALEKCVDIRKNLNVIDLKWHESINHILDNFERFVLNEKSHLSTSIIHGDINEQNLIVRQHEMTEDQRLPNQFEFGLIDFSDVHLAPTVFDLAIFITYVLIVFFEVDGLKAAKHVVDGFQSVTSLTKYEQQVLPVYSIIALKLKALITLLIVIYFN